MAKKATSNTSFCPDCKRLISMSAEICPNCGAKPTYEQKLQSLQEAKDNEKKRNKKQLITFGIIMLLAALFGAYLDATK